MTVTTTFLLVRHAESEANHGAYFGGQSDSVLTPRGRAQVDALHAAMAEHVLHAAYSSDLSRARDTVMPLAQSRGLSLNETRVLRERHMGAFTGMSFADAQRLHPEVWSRWQARDLHLRPPEGESYMDIITRVSPFLSELESKHRGETVLIGSHGGTLNSVLRHLLGIGEAPVWFSFDNASVTRVDVLGESSARAVRLVYLNRRADDARGLFG